MALTKDFKETAKKRIQGDPQFAADLLKEAVNLMLDGDAQTAKATLRELINATIGFEDLSKEVHKPAKSLHRMMSLAGNPTMDNLSSVFAAIKKSLHVRIDTKVILYS